MAKSFEHLRYHHRSAAKRLVRYIADHVDAVASRKRAKKIAQLRACRMSGNAIAMNLFLAGVEADWIYGYCKRR